MEQLPANGKRILKQVPLAGVRKVIAANMEKSREVVHTSSFIRIDISNMQRVKQQLAEQGTPVSFTALYFKLIAYALGRSPHLNASFIPQTRKIEVYESVNIGMAVTVANEMIMVPVVKDCDQKSVVEIAATIKELTDRARANELTTEDFADATFSVSNLGMYEIDAFAPIVVPPQVAIVGIGNAKPEPVVDAQGNIVVRPIAYFSLNNDHRYVLGGHVMEFYQAIIDGTNNAEQILLA